VEETIRWFKKSAKNLLPAVLPGRRLHLLFVFGVVELRITFTFTFSFSHHSTRDVMGHSFTKSPSSGEMQGRLRLSLTLLRLDAEPDRCHDQSSSSSPFPSANSTSSPTMILAGINDQVCCHASKPAIMTLSFLRRPRFAHF
jgi:hypothetical protein